MATFGAAESRVTVTEADAVWLDASVAVAAIVLKPGFRGMVAEKVPEVTVAETPFTLTATGGWPPLTEPVTVIDVPVVRAPFAGLLMAMDSAGAATVNVEDAVPVLPAWSRIWNWTVCDPTARSLGGV